MPTNLIWLGALLGSRRGCTCRCHGRCCCCGRCCCGRCCCGRCCCGRYSWRSCRRHGWRCSWCGSCRLRCGLLHRRGLCIRGGGCGCCCCCCGHRGSWRSGRGGGRSGGGSGGRRWRRGGRGGRGSGGRGVAIRRLGGLGALRLGGRGLRGAARAHHSCPKRRERGARAATDGATGEGRREAALGDAGAERAEGHVRRRARSGGAQPRRLAQAGCVLTHVLFLISRVLFFHGSSAVLSLTGGRGGSVPPSAAGGAPPTWRVLKQPKALAQATCCAWSWRPGGAQRSVARAACVGLRLEGRGKTNRLNQTRSEGARARAGGQLLDRPGWAPPSVTGARSAHPRSKLASGATPRSRTTPLDRVLTCAVRAGRVHVAGSQRWSSQWTRRAVGGTRTLSFAGPRGCTIDSLMRWRAALLAHRRA